MRRIRQCNVLIDAGISIHAPLTGCDVMGWSIDLYCVYFNPRTPYGMRLSVSKSMITFSQFQSTHPLRDATDHIQPELPNHTISIHAPLTGCDHVFETSTYPFTVFQSTHPLRDATAVDHEKALLFHNFNPRTPYGMRPDVFDDNLKLLIISIHAPLTGCDLNQSQLT